MNVSTLPHFYQALSQRFQGFDYYLSGWEDIELSSLRNLESFLEEELANFQNMVLHDKANDFPGSSFVSDILKTLRTFICWTEQLPVEYLNPQSSDDEKFQLLREINMKIAFLWIPWLENDYAPIIIESEKVPHVMPLDNLQHQNKKNREEKLAEKYREEIFSKIIGATPQVKERIFNVLKLLLNGKGGAELAPYLQAAKELKLITRKPLFPAMKMYWGIINKSSALSRYMSDDYCSIDEEIVEAKKDEIRALLSSSA